MDGISSDRMSNVFPITMETTAAVNITTAYPYLEVNPEDADYVLYTFAAFIFLLIPFILVGNALVLLAIARTPKLRVVTNYFVASLAVSDVMVGAAAIPSYAVNFIKPELMDGNKIACFIMYAFIIESCGASLLNLLCVSVDRYVAIIHPLRYLCLVTPRRAKLAILFLWSYTTLVSLMPIMGWNIWDETSMCDFYLIYPVPYIFLSNILITFGCISLSTTLYFMIFRAARRQHVRMKIDAAHMGPAIQKRLDKDINSAKLMAIVLLVFVIFWLPVLVAAPLKLLPSHYALFSLLKNCALCISFANSMANPIIYALLRKDFRNAFKKILHLRHNRVETIFVETSYCRDTDASPESLNEYKTTKKQNTISNNIETISSKDGYHMY